MSWSVSDVAMAWGAIRHRNPLIYHITNAVAMNEQAHVMLAVGASPIMSWNPLEAGDLTRACDGVLINIGTPTRESAEAAFVAVEEARSAGKPLLLDPVGYGATALRSELTERLLESGAPAIVKGNGSEISLLAGAGGAIRGVDAVEVGDSAKAAAGVAKKFHCLAIATGKYDYVSDGRQVWAVRGGHVWLKSLTGSGCWAGSLVLAAVVSCGDELLGSVAALVAFGIAAEKAASISRGPGTFRANLFDVLSSLTPGDFEAAGVRWDKRQVL